MARSTRPRKAYRPKSVGKPITGVARNQLVLPAHVALWNLERVTDAATLGTARHDLAAALDTALASMELAQMDTTEVKAAIVALEAVIARHAVRGVYRATGPELQAMRAGLTAYDSAIGYLRTHHLVGGIAIVNAAIEAQEQHRIATPANKGDS